MPPSPALTDPAATLPGEADLLAAVVAGLADDTPKLVYADWLEEHGDSGRAAYLRAFVAALRSGDPLPPADPFPRAWPDLVGASIVAVTRKYGLGGHARRFLGLARPGFVAASRAADDAKLPVGASKFGGRPDLPDDVDWPADDEGDPLALLAQYNLADLAGSVAGRDLPPAGLISIFAAAVEGDAPEPDDARVLYLPDTAALARRRHPAELDSISRFASRRLLFGETLMLPDNHSPWWADIGLGDDERAWDAYRELIDTLALGHRVLGYPMPIQSDPLGGRSVRHLLTVDSDDDMGWTWGDGGSLYFTIGEADLRAGRLGRARCEMQCC
ncbi:MAG: DUF1963 domain-containing protein [Gemmataceae bacterium]|nr:DUF1963 domain-containing protein [Gemmataceae bacterium]